MKDVGVNMPDVPVYIPIESKSREYDGKLLLSAYLLHSGYREVYIGSRMGILYETLFNKPGILILKSLSRLQEDYYRKLKARGFFLVLLHVEGGIHYRNTKDTMQSYYPLDLLSYIDYNFVFGEQIRKDIAIYCSPGSLSAIVVSGEPRFELLKPKYRQFFHDKVVELQAHYHDFILINTSFSAGNPVTGRDSLRDFILSEPTYSDEAKRLYLVKMNFLEGVIQQYLSAIKNLSRSFPNLNFIVRTHPSESEIVYNDAFRNLKNVYVVKEGNVVEWIIAAKGVIHYDCTTGMEALLAEKPVISFLPSKLEEIIAWLPVELSKVVENEIDLVNSVESILNGTFCNPTSHDLYLQWKAVVHNVDADSAAIVSSAMSKIDLGFFQSKTSIPLKLFYYRILSYCKAISKNIKRVINKFSSTRRKEYLNKELQISSVMIGEVENKLDKINAISGFTTKYRVMKKGYGIIKICKY